MRDEVRDVAAYIKTNMSAGNQYELGLIFDAPPENVIDLCIANSDHFYCFRDGDFAGLVGIGQVDPWAFSSWAFFSAGIERRQITAYRQGRKALAEFDRVLPRGCHYQAGIPRDFAAGRHFARHLGFRETGEYRRKSPMIRLVRETGCYGFV